MKIRFSRNEDLLELKGLFITCFGANFSEESLWRIKGRYLLYINEDKIVAVSGLSFEEEGIELDWTCVHPDYCDKEYIHSLLTRLLIQTDEEIYFRCHKIPKQERMFLYDILKELNFFCGCRKINKLNCCQTNIDTCKYYREFGCSS